MDPTDHFDDPGLLEGAQGPGLTSRNGSEWFAMVENDLQRVVSRWANAFTEFFLHNPCEVSNLRPGMGYLIRALNSDICFGISATQETESVAIQALRELRQITKRKRIRCELRPIVQVSQRPILSSPESTRFRFRPHQF
jgi:hypothetical protein